MDLLILKCEILKYENIISHYSYVREKFARLFNLVIDFQNFYLSKLLGWLQRLPLVNAALNNWHRVSMGIFCGCVIDTQDKKHNNNTFW